MSQAQTFSDAQPNTPTPVKPTGTKVFIPSVLTLTLEQERRLLDFCREKLEQVESDLGRTDFNSSTWLSQPTVDLQRSTATHFGKRHLAHLVKQQRMDWRAYVLGGLYAESNLHLPITARILGQQTARANKNFFGTSPWFSVDGLSADSDGLAADANAYGRHKLVTLGGLQGNLETAVDLTFTLGECVMKTRHYKMASYFESYREIAVDPATGQPIIALDGDYIYKTDTFIANEQGVAVLARDGQTPAPTADVMASMQQIKLNLVQMLADRIESRPLYYLDFLAPLDSEDIQQQECFHLYTASVIELSHRFLTDSGWETADVESQIARIRDLVTEFLPGTPSEGGALSGKPRTELGEHHQNMSYQTIEPQVELVECWVWFDVFGDGVQRSLMVLMDRQGKLPVYYDYVANLTPDGLRPFDVMRINPVSGRWYGQGNVEMFYGLQEHADLILNRYLFAESRAARVDFWDPSKTIEGQQNPNLELNWGGTYRLQPGATSAEALTPVYLTNIKSANLRELLDICLQMATTMSSVGSVNDSQMAGLDSQTLATGIKNLERNGEEMFHEFISKLQPVIESICRRCLRYLLAGVREKDEAQRIEKFFDRASQRLVEIDPAQIADLDFDIKLELTTYKNQAMLQQAQMGYAMVADFLLKPSPIQLRLTSFVSQYLKALEIRNADQIAAPLTPEEQMMMMPPAPEAPMGLPAPAPEIPL